MCAVYLYRMTKLGGSDDLSLVDFLSTASSWMCLGVTVSKCPQLKQLWAYRMKQTEKVLVESSTNEDIANWLKRMGNDQLCRALSANAYEAFIPCNLNAI